MAANGNACYRTRPERSRSFAQMIIDTHSHVIAPDRDRYPLQPYGLDQGTGEDRTPASWFEDVPASAEQLISEMDKAGVEGALLVQAMGAYSYDNSYVADSAVANAERFSSVVIVDMEAEDPAGTLHYWVETRGARGVRLFTITKPMATWLDDPKSYPVWEAASRLGIPIVVAMLPSLIPSLRNVVERFPNVPVALDHFGFPDLDGGPPYPNATAHFDLAAYSNIRLKISSNLLERADAVGHAEEFMEFLVDRFGANRLMWGSDYSQTHDRSYSELLSLAKKAVSRLSVSDQRLYLGETAYGLWPELGRNG